MSNGTYRIKIYGTRSFDHNCLSIIKISKYFLHSISHDINLHWASYKKKRIINCWTALNIEFSTDFLKRFTRFVIYLFAHNVWVYNPKYNVYVMKIILRKINNIYRSYCLFATNVHFSSAHDLLIGTHDNFITVIVVHEWIQPWRYTNCPYSRNVHTYVPATEIRIKVTKITRY